MSRLQSAPSLGDHQVDVSIADPSGLLACFPDSGDLTIVVRDDRVDVLDDADSDPVLVVTADAVMLRPSAFSAGPDEWWRLDDPIPDRAVDRVVGPVVTGLALDDDLSAPHDQMLALVGTAQQVERLGVDRFRIVDDTVDPTVLEVTLDRHGHLEQLDVAAEDPTRPGAPDVARPSYTARYRDRPSSPAAALPDPAVRVDGARLDGLDTRPGACEPVVAP